MWFVGTQVHFFTFRKASTLSHNALPFKGSSILGRSFCCIQSSGLSPTWQFSPVKVEKVTVFRFCMFLVYCLLLFSPEFYFQSCLCHGENIRTPLFLVPGYVSAWTISRQVWILLAFKCRQLVDVYERYYSEILCIFSQQNGPTPSLHFPFQADKSPASLLTSFLVTLLKFCFRGLYFNSINVFF